MLLILLMKERPEGPLTWEERETLISAFLYRQQQLPDYLTSIPLHLYSWQRTFDDHWSFDLNPNNPLSFAVIGRVVSTDCFLLPDCTNDRYLDINITNSEDYTTLQNIVDSYPGALCTRNAFSSFRQRFRYFGPTLCVGLEVYMDRSTIMTPGLPFSEVKVGDVIILHAHVGEMPMEGGRYRFGFELLSFLIFRVGGRFLEVGDTESGDEEDGGQDEEVDENE
ncbi:hypothetical protein K440DRAFT_643311 [Wilcoxina mikolae CBS 423.85]|nr:hypothetical protein K440DRAFT_643311 [Wilcoxina mikolae CBS 423.85]